MVMTKHLMTARALGVVFVAALTLGACATRDDIAQINSRLDSIDAQVQSAAQNSQSANESAMRANQRLDSIEGRIQQLETQPARGARG
jgi:murein lipoprotein